jgi:hypothetical protein
MRTLEDYMNKIKPPTTSNSFVALKQMEGIEGEEVTVEPLFGHLS